MKTVTWIIPCRTEQLHFIGSEQGYWLNEIYATEIKKAHTEGDFHIHDLSLLSVYCVGWDLYDLLLQGFKGCPGRWKASQLSICDLPWVRLSTFFILFRVKQPVPGFLQF